MKVKVELTPAELEEAGCDSVEEFKKGFIHQLEFYGKPVHVCPHCIAVATKHRK